MDMSTSENRYFNADKLITHNAVYEIVLSARNSGKAFFLSRLKQAKNDMKRKGQKNGHNV